VAEIDDRIVGTILFEDAATTAGCGYYDRPGVASFHQFAVEPEWQGRGIGSRLLAHVEARAAETGAAEIALDTAEEATHLIALYNRRGYCIVDHADWDETNYVSVIMSRPARVRHAAAAARTGEELA
jgi:GNAT superfamily N-acetyltransferase